MGGEGDHIWLDQPASHAGVSQAAMLMLIPTPISMVCRSGLNSDVEAAQYPK